MIQYGQEPKKIKMVVTNKIGIVQGVDSEDEHSRQIIYLLSYCSSNFYPLQLVDLRVNPSTSPGFTHPTVSPTGLKFAKRWLRESSEPSFFHAHSSRFKAREIVQIYFGYLELEIVSFVVRRRHPCHSAQAIIARSLAQFH